MEINFPPSSGLTGGAVTNKVLKDRLNKYLPSIYFENGSTPTTFENRDKLTSEYQPGLKLF
jgi:hypothetical protein